MSKHYELTEKDIDTVLTILKSTDSDNATPEKAIAILEHLYASVHILGHDNPDMLEKIFDDLKSSKRRKLLIVGASSYVGARIYYDLELFFNTVGTYHSNKLSDSFVKLDITDNDEVNELVKEQNPDVIVHVANHASARPAKDDEEGYTKLNLEATKHLVEAANNNDAKIIFISSFAALNPGDIYGKLKSKSEDDVRKTKAGYLILRPSLIVGFSPNTTNDRPFNRILKCIDEGNKAEFDTSWKFQPTYVGHLSQVIQQAIQKGMWNTTIPVVINELVTQHKVATDILKEFNIEVAEIDKGYNLPPAEADFSELNQFDLAPRDYKRMVKTIVKEIKNRENFKIV